MNLISHNKKSIFFHVPKTGGSTVTNILKIYNWKSYSTLTKYQLDRYYLFLFVRNPYDRFLSGWKRTMIKYKEGKGKMTDYRYSIKDFHNDYILEQFNKNENSKMHFYFTQTQIIGKLLKYSNDIFKFEKFYINVNKILKKFNYSLAVPHENILQRVNYKKRINNEIALYIEDKYADDFLNFGYKKEIFK